MRVKLLLFASYRDIAGTSELVLEMPAGANAHDAVRVLRAKGEVYARIPEHPVVAINETYASLDDLLNDGDELALLPPVAGG